MVAGNIYDAWRRVEPWQEVFYDLDLGTRPTGSPAYTPEIHNVPDKINGIRVVGLKKAHQFFGATGLGGKMNVG